jgi:hypothetical protein
MWRNLRRANSKGRSRLTRHTLVADEKGREYRFNHRKENLFKLFLYIYFGYFSN